jgi:hypothetical protein
VTIEGRKVQGQEDCMEVSYLFYADSVLAGGVFPVIKSGKRLFSFFDVGLSFMLSNRTVPKYIGTWVIAKRFC